MNRKWLATMAFLLASASWAASALAQTVESALVITECGCPPRKVGVGPSDNGRTTIPPCPTHCSSPPGQHWTVIGVGVSGLRLHENNDHSAVISFDSLDTLRPDRPKQRHLWMDRSLPAAWVAETTATITVSEAGCPDRDVTVTGTGSMSASLAACPTHDRQAAGRHWAIKSCVHCMNARIVEQPDHDAVISFDLLEGDVVPPLNAPKNDR